MQKTREKELEAQIEKDQHFIDRMREMGEKWCSYLLIAEELDNAKNRIQANSEELKNLRNADS